MSVRNFFTCVLLSINTTLSAQSSISGSVKGGEEYLPGATVLLFHLNDSVLVKGTVAGSDGRFVFDQVPGGTYDINVSMIGYTKYWLRNIVVRDRDIALGDIIVSENVETLDEVIVRDEKPLFEQRADRLIVNVQSSVVSAGNSVIEVLQKSPGVTINPQSSTISINGKSGVRVMINGKAAQLPADVLVQMLGGMSASNVDQIEIIATPSSKYDAEGSAGVINIVTKENTEYGTNATIGITAGFKWAETLGANFNVNHRTKNFFLYADYSFLRTRNLHTMDLERHSMAADFDQAVVNNSRRKNLTNQQNLNLGAELKLSKKLKLDVLLTGYNRDWRLNAVTNDINSISPDSTINTRMDITELNSWKGGTASAGLRATPTANSEFSVSFDNLYYRNNNPSFYNNYQPANGSNTSMIDLGKKTPIRTMVAKADYQLKTSSAFTVEMGVKGVKSLLTNDVHVQKMADGEWKTDPAFSSYSDLRELIGAAYVATTWAPPHWQINTGLRYEYTHTSIGTPQDPELVNRKYGYFFPNVIIKRDLAGGRDLQLSYSKRITRPTYNDIAPFVFFWSPNIFSAGNTSLWPAVSEATRVEYRTSRWSAYVEYNHTAREIINLFQPEIDAGSNSLIFRSQNLAYLNTLALSGMWSFNIGDSWDVQSSLTLQHQDGRTQHLQQNIALDLWSVNLNATSIVKLPADFTIEVSAFYRSKAIYGISQFLPYGSLNAGIQKKLRKIGTLRLSMDDILYTNVWRIATDRPQENINSNIRYDWHNQYIRLTWSRNIGNAGLRTVKIKSGSTEEQGRVTN